MGKGVGGIGVRVLAGGGASVGIGVVPGIVAGRVSVAGTVPGRVKVGVIRGVVISWVGVFVP